MSSQYIEEKYWNSQVVKRKRIGLAILKRLKMVRWHGMNAVGRRN